MRFYMAPPQLDAFEIALSLFLFIQGRRNQERKEMENREHNRTEYRGRSMTTRERLYRKSHWKGKRDCRSDVPFAPSMAKQTPSKLIRERNGT